MSRTDLLKALDKKGGPRKQTIYQLMDFFTLFYLRFCENPEFTSWRSVQRSKPFYTWAGNTFELLVIEHMPQLTDTLRIKEYATPFSWRGDTPDGIGAQIDLVIPATADDIARHIAALRNSSIHKPTHSVYVTLITSFGVTESKHRSHLNDIVTLDTLF